ncbi:acyl-CoA dehydrogenase [Streptomyces viridochromogenes]|uniref:Acyl-CoA dehydrogenase n=1 Tax=Streptomyces viridochromogenes TaxID=1938 RepID=A0A0J8CDG9_STRVR|nr:acyl-CoA dehydrogenase family protein [Streptomyces viridochromogenes]KMS75920.1 acyl-CoA dehydrogenase [Streptomyces viridochromogenes]KOG07500.1 acyl-CoA dehydrogenase [Streptomyces viridochromogenes]KOG12641.1 acyl-CoA dehydrogenase [Streptomyces viridochromogenes]
MDAAERALLEDALRKSLTTSGPEAEPGAALAELGWTEMLAEEPGTAIPLVFRLLGETGSQAPVLNDVVLLAAGRPLGGTPPLPYAGGAWVRWLRGAGGPAGPLDPGLPLRHAEPDDLPAPAVAAGRRALGWWLLGTGRAMLTLTREHVLDREQFGRPLASFQALRHRLAETYVALEAAEAVLVAAGAPDTDRPAVQDTEALDDADALHHTGALLAKAAAGRAALTAARHCQQALGGIGFTAEHALHRHVKRALVLDGLLGSTRELTREAGRLLLREARAPRLVDL